MDEKTRQNVERWFIKAENDLRAAKNSLEDPPPLTDIACFHAQQCAEKVLKAFLSAHNAHIEKTHSLPRLVEMCRAIDTTLTEMMPLAKRLTDYAVTTRYPDEGVDYTVEEARQAVMQAEEMLAFVKGKVGG